MSFERNGYLVLKSVISKEMADFIYAYFLNKRLVANTLLSTQFLKQDEQFFGNWTDEQIPGTYSHYSDIVMETLLQKLKPIMEEATKIKLIETYSYARIYKKGDILHRHKDRASCEISTTLNLGGPQWPIFLEPDASKGWQGPEEYVSENTEGVKIILNPGDMLIYRGCDLEYWREPFDSEDCAQVFLHYVRAHGEFADTFFDIKQY